MMWTARSPSSSFTKRTVTFTLGRNFPSTRVLVVIKKVRRSELFPKTVRTTVILSAESSVTIPEKKSL